MEPHLQPGCSTLNQFIPSPEAKAGLSAGFRQMAHPDGWVAGQERVKNITEQWGHRRA